MKYKVFLFLIVFFSARVADAQICSYASPSLDVQGPLYARGNIFTLSNAENNWIPWATRNTSLSEVKIDLSNINNAFFLGNVGIGIAPSSVKLDVAGTIRATDIDINNHLQVFGPLYTRGNLYTVNKAENEWISWATRNTLTSEATIDLSSINNAFILGNLGIGVAPGSVKLDVAGAIRATEVKVCLNQGCDFVFDKTYKLMSIQDLDNFIKLNKHLPDIDPASKMENEGINLSEMNGKLLQKIEEQSLYIIELNKRLTELEKLIKK